jgi:ATP-dependent Zn protease
MGKNSMPEGVKTAMYWMLGIGMVALIGLVLLILFGNLSGNMGFAQTSVSITNEVGHINSTGYLLSNASVTGFASLSITGASNYTSGLSIHSGNYTYTSAGNVTNASATEWNNVTFNYTYTKNSDIEINSEDLIRNYTTSATNTGKQFPTVGTIVGIALLLVILIGILIFAIRKLMNVTGGSNFKGSGYKTKFSGNSRAEFG